MGKKLPFNVKQLIEMDGCSRCEICTENCSLYKLIGSNPHPLKLPTSCAVVIRGFRSLLRDRHGLKAKLLGSQNRSDEKIWNVAESLFLHCSVCGRCSLYCPLSIDTTELIIAMREYYIDFLSNSHCSVEFITMIYDLIEKHKNVFGIDNSMRADWPLYTGAEVRVKNSADTVYFVGCVSAFQGRAQDIASAISTILNTANEDWTVLEDEWCCGHPITVSGGSKRALEMAKHNIELIESIGAKRVVTGCPGCYLALKNEWPKLTNRELEFEVLHITELLNKYIEDGGLNIPKIEADITYHDPCELGRLGGVIKEPRKILKLMTDRFIEPVGSGIEGICCGSGGLLKALNPTLNEQLGVKRLDMLRNTGAKIIVSACPTCIQAFEQAARVSSNHVRIMDIAELIAENLS
jgi:heterodisulfide reductase subunit D